MGKVQIGKVGGGDEFPKFFLDLGDGRELNVHSSDQFHHLLITGFGLPKHAGILFGGLAILGVDQHVFMVSRVIRCLAIVGVHSPDEFLDAVPNAEHLIRDLLQHGPFGLVDADEHRTILRQCSTELIDTVIHHSRERRVFVVVLVGDRTACGVVWWVNVDALHSMLKIGSQQLQCLEIVAMHQQPINGRIEISDGCQQPVFESGIKETSINYEILVCD